MAVELAVTGTGHFTGARTNLAGYSITEDATPIDASDSSGGVGQITFDVIEDPAPDGTVLLLNNYVTLTDDAFGRGMASGKVISLSSDVGGQVSVTADARLGGLVVDKSAKPFHGTLGDGFLYYLGLAGITTNISVDSSIINRAVNWPAWKGTIWDYMKQMCTGERVEIALVNGVITLRPYRTMTVSNAANAEITWDVENSERAQNVEVYYYNNSYKTNAMAYPVDGWNPDLEVYQVEAGQTVTYTVDINASLETIDQPDCVLNIDRYYHGSVSQYAVCGNDGLPIPVGMWKNGGGKLTVAIGKEPNTMVIKITGMRNEHYAPYRIAVSSSPSDSYSALRITGTGVFFNKTLLTVPTGAPLAKAPQEVGVTIDNPFIDNADDAYTAAMTAASAFAAPAQTISVTTTGLTQGIGNIAGSRVLFRQCWYRIRSATTTQDNVTYTAERDTTFAELGAVWAGATFAQFSTRWSGKTFEDLALITLWR